MSSASGTPLSRVAARGAAATAIAQVAKLGIQLAGLVVLSRLLTPHDFGMLAMIVALIGVGELVRDFGLSSAAIQAREVSPAQRGALFWINTAIGAALALAVFLAAGAIAAFFGRPELVPIAQALGVTFLINGLITQYKADLYRRMQFRRVGVAEVGAQGLGLATAVLGAVAGIGYWALVLQQLVQPAVLLLTVVLMGKWLPGRPRRGVDVKPYLAFGGNLMATQLLGYLSRNVDSILVGRLFGPAALGLYDRAFQILMLPLNQISAPSTTVALPVLSRLQDDRARYDTFLLRGQTILLHLVLAVSALTFALAEVLVPIVFGPQWAESVPILRVLTIGGVFQMAGYVGYWVFLSKGLTRQNLWYAAVSKLVTIIAVVIGAQFGVLAVAVGYSTGLAIGWPLLLWWLHRCSDAPARRLLVNGARALGYHSLIAAAGAVTAGVLLATSQILAIFGAITAMAAVVGLLWLAIPAFRADLHEIVASRSLLAGRVNRVA